MGRPDALQANLNIMQDKLYDLEVSRLSTDERYHAD